MLETALSRDHLACLPPPDMFFLLYMHEFSSLHLIKVDSITSQVHCTCLFQLWEV